MRSLKRALLAYILCGVSIVVLGAGIAVFLVARSNFRAQLDEALIDRANTLGSLVVEEDGVLEFEYEQPLDEEHVGVLVRITADDGTIIAQSPRWPSDHVATAPPAHERAALADLRIESGDVARAATITKRATRDPGGAAETPQFSERSITVEVIGRTDSVQRAESAVLIALIIGGLFAIIGASIAVWLGIRRGLVPVRDLGNAVEEIDTNELILPRASGIYPHELQPIVTALERMLDRLRAALARERRFTDAAAHELRTPIAELKTITDVADRWPDPDRLHRGVKDARRVVRQMEDLLESLLAAARGSTADSQQSESVDLMPLARTITDEAIVRLHRQDIDWSFEGNGQGTWRGPRGVITAIVRNLIENAAEYTPAGGDVRVRVLTNGAGTALEVENGPVTITQAELDHIFEPFWRADASRTDRNHRGLGLTIVESLASAMNLERNAAITPEGRLRVRLVSR